ncbi:bacteriophage protein [Burkholderia aenigmatica]|uniref:Bacteriophage protein n=1 Tax=Burkholderia aenigmatica TaxID=2015348 RepID=A0ABY6Y0Q3_9BURK|nr:hypothetical protein [Burkholderia aenigmatica]VWD01522.1 bacteriophage protein [Burkholderia aenigmatica]
MTTNTYGGYTVDQLREFIAHTFDTEHGGDTIDELTGDTAASANIVRDLLDAIEPQQDGDLLRPVARWVYNAVRVNLDLLHGICGEFGCPQGADVATWLRDRLSNEKSPAPEQASEAVNQRPGMTAAFTEVVPTAEDILDACAAGGNGTSSKVSRADALTDHLYILSVNEEAMEEAIERFDGSSTGEALKCVLHAQKQLRAVLVQPVEQHEAAPASDEQIPPIMYNGDTKRDPALRELLARQMQRNVLTNPRGNEAAPLEGTGNGADEASIRKSMTSEQIRLERKLTCEAIDGAMAFGYQNTNPPPSADHWLAPYWHVGRKQAELEAALSRAPRTEVAGAVPRSVIFSLECTANWLEGGCDPKAAAHEIRLNLEKLRAPSADAAAAPGSAIRERIARALHYPACWDTAAYPTLESAAWEAIAAAKIGCSACEAAPADERDVIEPLTEPVSIAKAMLGGMRARVGGNGESTTAFLVNIQIASWGYPTEWVKGCVFGFNRAAKWMQSALLEYQSAQAASQPAAEAGQEAVAYVCSSSNDFAPIVRDKDSAQRLSDAHGDGKIVPLYTAPPAQVATRQGADDAIDYAIQVLRQVEAGDGTFVGQCADAIAGLEDLLEGAKR